MIRRMILSRLAREEHRLGESVEYVRYILHVSLRAFFRFAKIFSIAEYRDRLPADAYHVARIVAARDEDCGTCVQIEINLAKASGVPSALLQAVINRNLDALPHPILDVYRFVEMVVTSAEEDDSLRQNIITHYGERGLVELALAIGASRFFPIVKRTLGHATTCANVHILT